MAVGEGFSRELSLTGGDDTPIKISLSSMLDHLQCAICKGSLHNVSLTSCGHRYCRQCIAEWVGRRHECPVCRSPLTNDEMIADKLFDELIDTIYKEKKKEEDAYFKQAATRASEDALSSSTSFRDKERFVPPLEAVLRKHLKKTLQIHEVYHQQIISECKKSQSRAHREKAIRIEQVMRRYPHDPDHPERVKQMRQIEEDWDKKRKSLDDELIRIETILTTTYDKYLEKNLPSPSTLPITVQLSVPQKGFIANDVIVKPSDTMDHILKKLRELMLDGKMDIAEFPPCEELQISLLSPFAAERDDSESSSEEMSAGTDYGGAYKPTGKKMGQSEGQQEAEDEGLTSLVHTTLHGDCRPVMQYGLKSGSEIRVEGKIVLEGEQPRVCFAASFTKGQAKSVDYFICRTCNNTTWICQNCANVCHREHDLIPHRMNHISTWACCYCPRKTECYIFTDK